jgi:RNA-directed DNA polymerase
VKANKGAAGIDRQSIEAFEENLKDNLYKVWNKMSSGSYFPPPVKEVEIPKKSGGKRMLGIPTVSDRIAQTVVKMYFEPRVEPYFCQDSYGYRPGKSALDAKDNGDVRSLSFTSIQTPGHGRIWNIQLIPLHP